MLLLTVFAYHADLHLQAMGHQFCVRAPMHTSTLEAIAERGGEPSPASLEHDASVDDSQHAASWEDVVA